MLSRSSCLAYAPDRRLSGCRAVHSRRLPSAPRLRPAVPRCSRTTTSDAKDRKPRTALSSGSRNTSEQGEGPHLHAKQLAWTTQIKLSAAPEKH